ncbi:MAG: HPr family phosphocarrier protein [Butyrivibrio sp.]|nr:HPr family phosphocarrier protein [Butyrivibrio sp.]
MKVFCYTVKDPEGVHALPAGDLVKLANTFSCSITAEGNHNMVDAKHLFGIMSLGVKHGQTLTIKCEGPDENEAAAALEKYMIDNL